MRTLFSALIALTRRAPALLLVGVLAVTGVWAGFASQTVTVDDDATVNRPEVVAQEQLAARFGQPETVVQVLVRATDGGDVRRADALAMVGEVEAALESSPVAARLAERAGRPAVVSYLDGAAQAAAMTGADPAVLSDADVRDLQEQALANAPAEVRALTEDLLGPGDPPTTGLVVVFLDVADLPEPEPGEDDPEAVVQQAVARAVEGVEPPAGLALEPFAFGLLFADNDIGPEVGRLFGTAFLIILLVLATVYWVRPGGRGRRGPLVRRTAADVGLTLVAILVAIVWMQGAGVLLGPDYLGLIGYFTPQTQIVPILVIGLGVDYAIHLTARYRDELAAGGSPDAAVAAASRTVGVALVLATATTAVGFLTNLVSPVSFLQTFGVLAALGILAAFAVTLTFVPAARLLLDRRAERRGRLPRTALASQRQRLLPEAAARTSVLAERAPVATLAVAVVLGGLGAYGLTQLDSRFSLTDFVPQDAPALATFETLEADFGGGFAETTEVLLDGPVATPAAHNALVDATAALGDVPEVADAGGRPDADTAVSVVARAVAEDPELAATLGEAGLGDDLRVSPDTDVASLYGLVLEEVPAASEVLDAEGEAFVGRAVLRTTAGEDGAGALASAVEVAFSPVAAAGVDVTVTSPEIVQAAVSADIEGSQLTALAVALGAAMLLLVAHFWVTARRPLLGVVTIAPVGLVLLWTFGMMALTGIPLNPVTATLAALAIGIGVPFTIHVTHRFTELRASSPDVVAALRGTARQTGGALAGSALTTMIGFGVLTTSTLVPFRQLGFVTVYAIGFALLASVLVLPSLLRLWDRWDRRAGRVESGEAAGADRAPAAAAPTGS